MTDIYLERRTAKRITNSTHKRWLKTMLLERFSHESKPKIAADLADLINHLEEERIRDPLTGAFNRGFIAALLSEELHHKHKIGVMMLDLDHFKTINDREPDGHVAGDRALKAFVQILQQIVKDKGTLGRWGGEEWLLIIPDTTKNKLYNLAIRINKKIANSLAQNAKLVRPKVTVSIGAYFVPHGKTLVEVINSVDQLVYQAKKEGRNKVVSNEKS